METSGGERVAERRNARLRISPFAAPSRSTATNGDALSAHGKEGVDGSSPSEGFGIHAVSASRLRLIVRKGCAVFHVGQRLGDFVRVGGGNELRQVARECCELLAVERPQSEGIGEAEDE